jgi:hypothetical protein
MRERPKTIQHLYEEFEKYCCSDNDFRMCMEEQSQQKKKSVKANQPSEKEWHNPRNASHANPRGVFGLDSENTQENPNPQADSQSLVPNPPSPPHSNQGEATGAEEAEVEVGVEAGAEATTRKENGIVFSTRKTMTTTQIIAQTRKDSKPSLRRKERKRRERVP